MRQHKVPRLHLRNFTQSKNQIIVYERNRSPYPAGIDRVCAENDCYTVFDPATGQPDIRLEKDFGRLENDAAGPLRKLIGEDLPLTVEDVCHLSSYVAFLISRSPAFIEVTKTHHLWNGEQLRVLCENGDRQVILEFFAKHGIPLEPHPEFGISTKEGMADAVVDLVLDQGKLSLSEEEMGKNYWLNRIIGFGNKLGQIINSTKYWNLGTPVHSTRYFITSDNPVVPLDSSFIGRTPTRYLGLAKGILCLPITPEKILFMHNEPMVTLEILADSLVDYLNYLQMFYSHKRVLSNHKKKAIQVTFDTVAEGAGQNLLLRGFERDFEGKTQG